MTSVLYRDAFRPSLRTVVTLAMGGQATFPDCVADQFDPGVVTLTSTTDGRDVRVLDGVTSAVVLDHNNQIVYALDLTGVQQERKSA